MPYIEYPPCEVCGRRVDIYCAKKCNNCWEVERRLDQYLESAKGMKFVLKLLKEMGINGQESL